MIINSKHLKPYIFKIEMLPSKHNKDREIYFCLEKPIAIHNLNGIHIQHIKGNVNFPNERLRGSEKKRLCAST